MENLNTRWFESALQEVGMEKLLKGEGGYALPNVYWDTPTDDTMVFSAVTTLYGNDAKAMAALLEAIEGVSRDPDYSWTALYYVYHVIAQPTFFGADFDLQGFVTDISNNVRGHEQHLRTLKRWAGRTLDDGCWSCAHGLLGVIEAAARRAMAQ
jgi:hypothetical protein